MRLDRSRVGRGLIGGATKAVVTGIVLVLAISGCGGDEPAESTPSQGTGDQGMTETPSPTPSGLTGEWTPNPGQADKVQAALTAKGFECTRNADPNADLRVCSKGVMTGKATDLGGRQIGQANLRFLSDSEGTVVLAAVEASGDVADLEKTMLQSFLPAADAAVMEADGTKLTWGTAEKGTDSQVLTINGWDSSKTFVPAFTPLKTTKEQALPPLQAAKLKCAFSETDEWGSTRPGLSCKDLTFKVREEDGSIAGATAELVLVDHGSGIDRVILDGSHSRKPAENARGVRLMVPRAMSVDPDPGLQAAGAWVLEHLDGLPHSGYAGRWRVDVVVVPSGGIAGWPYVKAILSTDKPNLGMAGAETPSYSPSEPSESPQPSESESAGG